MREVLRTDLGMEETPVLFFQSVPDRPRGLVPGMYADGGLRDVLSGQHTLRGLHAFNWASAYKRPEPREGVLLLAEPSRRGLLIEADGAVTGAVSATAEMLGWAMLAEPGTPLMAMLVWLGYINIAIAIFNMIPGFPMDGGRVLRAAVWWKTGDMTFATRVAAMTGQVVAFGFIVLGIMRFFGGAVSVGVARPIDHGAGWRVVWGLAQQL